MGKLMGENTLIDLADSAKLGKKEGQNQIYESDKWEKSSEINVVHFTKNKPSDQHVKMQSVAQIQGGTE